MIQTKAKYHIRLKTIPNVSNSSLDTIKTYYDQVLNIDKSTFCSSNDEPTPIDCVQEMVSKIPEELWTRQDLSILDPCCGNGNFFIPIFYKLLEIYDKKIILEKILSFNDINTKRLYNVRKVYCDQQYKLNISNYDYLITNNINKYDLIVANPPYAKLMTNGKRSSKNHNLIKCFIEKSISLLKPKGYIMFITPDNWMSFADRNTIISTISQLQIIHLDIHNAKKHFKKIGSSFTWYIIQNCPYYQDINITGIWKNKQYNSIATSQQRRYIPLFYNNIIQNINVFIKKH